MKPLDRWCRKCKREAGSQCIGLDGKEFEEGYHHPCRFDEHVLTDGPEAITALKWLETHDAYGYLRRGHEQ